ncbi:MerR family transcriptional regulator [Candidatus Uhrbacteria bacterium]|nr:MerR family transcriptional regulator [Candidatus Uhrbacteria bacterium]
MLYSIHGLASIAKVSVRTLHYYDEIDLLKPSTVTKNGYRKYGETELLHLQQILFFKELDIPLAEIHRILHMPQFNLIATLQNHKQAIEQKKKHLHELLKTIERTINKLERQTSMKDTELYESFTPEQQELYQKEAEQRWGNTDAFRCSTERVKNMSKEQLQEIGKQGIEWTKKLSTLMDKDPASSEIQTMIAQHYNGLRTFYEPNLELYRGLADMYVTDARFTAFYDKHHPGLATFMQKAMHVFINIQQNKTEK